MLTAKVAFLDEDRVEEFGEFGTALDSIDASMKTVGPMIGVNRQELPIAPEALAQIVSAAVADAIAAYERARGKARQPVRGSTTGGFALHAARAPAPQSPANPATPPTPWTTRLAQLQANMGLDEIEFDEASPRPAVPAVPVGLSAEMGIDDFVFEDALPSAARHARPTGGAIYAVELTPPDLAISPAKPDLNDDHWFAPTEQTSDAALANWDEEGLKWVAAQLETHDASGEPTAPPDTTAPEASGAIEFGPDGPSITTSGTRLVARLRSVETRVLALVRRAGVLTRVALERRAHHGTAAKGAPEPPAAAVSAPVEREPTPAAALVAPSKPLTREKAAATIFFTFDPIPPVPPRIPREPRND